MTIACVGITVLDRVSRVHKLPAGGGKYVAHDYFEFGGGPAATAAVAIRRLGMAAEFIGRVGSDDVAKSMMREFDQYGVGHRFVQTFPGASSSFSSILVDDAGERVIVNYQDPALSRDPSWLSAIDVSQFDALLCDVRWHEGALHALGQAKRAGIPSVLDADLTPEDIGDLVALADHVVFSEPGLAKFTQCDDPLEGLRLAQKRTDGKVYVTVGSKGCYWFDEDEGRHQPGFVVDVKDTTGAGDVFHGAFAYGVAKGMATPELVRFASAVAALKCTRFGGRDGVPDLESVSRFLDGMR